MVEFAGAAVLAAASAIVLAPARDPGRHSASARGRPVQASLPGLDAPARIAAEEFPGSCLVQSLSGHHPYVVCADMGTPTDQLPDEMLLAGLGAGDADLSIAFVRRFQSSCSASRWPSSATGRRGRCRPAGLRAGLAACAGLRLAPRVRPRLAEDDRPQSGRRRHPRATRRPVDPADLSAILTAVTDTPERSAKRTRTPRDCAARSPGCQGSRQGPWRWPESTA